MTREELEAIWSIKAEISLLEETIDTADAKTIHRFEMLERKVDRAENYIDTIEGEMQSILRMRYIYGMTLEEIGTRLNYDLSTIGKKLHNHFSNNSKHLRDLI